MFPTMLGLPVSDERGGTGVTVASLFVDASVCVLVYDAGKLSPRIIIVSKRAFIRSLFLSPFSSARRTIFSFVR